MKSGISKQELVDLLKAKIVEVTFKKSDGTTRCMKCTLIEQYVPIYENKTGRHKAANDDIVPVFDLDNNQWRSFKASSVMSVGYSGEYDGLM
jgi:hypothetical protein